MIPRAVVLLRLQEPVGKFSIILKPELVVEFLDFLIVNVTLRADPTFENLLLNPGGIDAKAHGVDLRSRFNQPLDCPANSFAVLRNVIEKLDFHVAREYVQKNIAEKRPDAALEILKAYIENQGEPNPP